MSTQTTYYNLIKPDGNELYDVDVFNDNADILDSTLHTIENNMSAVRPISEGGTGASSTSGARSNLGITPSNIGAVSKSGDTMNGNLYVQAASPAKVDVFNTTTERSAVLQSDSAGWAQIWNIDNFDSSNSQFLNIRPETDNSEDAISFTRRINGQGNTYRLFGEHNPSSLATVINSLIQNGDIKLIKSIQHGVVYSGEYSTTSGTIPLASGTNIDKCTWTVTGALGENSCQLIKETVGGVTSLKWYFRGSAGSSVPWEVVEYYM